MGPAQPLVGAIVGPAHWQPTGNERQLVVLLSHWSVPRGPLPQATVTELPLVACSVSCRQSGGPQVESETIGGSWLLPGLTLPRASG